MSFLPVLLKFKISVTVGPFLVESISRPNSCFWFQNRSNVLLSDFATSSRCGITQKTKVTPACPWGDFFIE